MSNNFYPGRLSALLLTITSFSKWWDCGTFDLVHYYILLRPYGVSSVCICVRLVRSGGWQLCWVRDGTLGKTRDFYISVILRDLWLENSRVNVLLYDPSLCG